MKSTTESRYGLLLAASIVSLAPAIGAADTSHRYIVTDSSPARAQLPFSDAVQDGNTLYVSGTLGLDPATGQAPADSKTEAQLVMEAVQRTLQAAGYQLEDLVSVQVFCTNLDLYGAFNDVYRGFFPGHFPARAFIGINQLGGGAHFEVMATAIRHASSPDSNQKYPYLKIH